MSYTQKDIQIPIKLEDILEYINAQCIAANILPLQETVVPCVINNSETKKFNPILTKYFADSKFIDELSINDVPTSLLDNNISLLSSLLSCIFDKTQFANLDKNEQLVCVTKFFDKILSEVKRRDGINKYITPTLIWDKKELVKNINEKNVTNNLFSYIVTYMNINVLIFSEETILAFYMGKTFNIFKQTILICKNEEQYNPIFYGSKKYLANSDELLSYILDTHKKSIVTFTQQNSDVIKEFTIGYDGDIELLWKPEINSTTNSKKIEEPQEKESSNIQKTDIIEENVASTSTVKPRKYNIIEITNKKYIELREIANTNQIKLTTKKDGKTKSKTKQELIDEILKLQ